MTTYQYGLIRRGAEEKHYHVPYNAEMVKSVPLAVTISGCLWETGSVLGTWLPDILDCRCARRTSIRTWYGHHGRAQYVRIRTQPHILITSCQYVRVPAELAERRCTARRRFLGMRIYQKPP